MSQAEARAWWADVEHLRERIERRRELEPHEGETQARRGESGPSAGAPSGRGVSGRARRGSVAATGADADGFRPRRTVRIRGQAIPTITAPRLHVAEDEPDFLSAAWQASRPAQGASADRATPPVARRRPRRTPTERLGHNPDRIAMWAVVLGIALVLAALLSAHGL